MVGIVVVSHSRPLARAVAGLAAQMAGERAPRIVVAAGLDETTLGTDATAVAAAIEEAAAGGVGVLVLVDLGSAVLSAEMALEFVDPVVAQQVVITSAPLVEGLVAAVVTAATGADLARVDAEARAGLLPKQAHLSGADSPYAAPVVAEAGGSTQVVTPAAPLRASISAPGPHGLHARPAAALVAALTGIVADVTLRDAASGRRADGRSLAQVLALGATAGAGLELEVAGAEAAAALAAVVALADNGFGESPPKGAQTGGADAEPSRADTSADDGAGAGPADVGRDSGSADHVAVGPVVRMEDDVAGEGAAYVQGGVEVERERSTAAVEAVRAHLHGLAAAHPVLAAQAAMLGDPDLSTGVAADLGAGVSAPRAWTARLDAAAAGIEALPDPYLRERAQDVRGLRRLVVTALGRRTLDATPLGRAGVLVLAELDAATATTLDRAVTRGVVTTSGGGTGHGVLVARARGIPVITGHPEAATLAAGTIVAIDPADNALLIDPAPDELAELERRQRDRDRHRARASAGGGGAAYTRGGTRIRVEVNVSALDDADRARGFGADGLGVVRSELLFATAVTPPTAAEQARIYRRLASAVPGPVTIRTWVAGGDKPLAFLPTLREANPFLGVRGIRLTMRAPEVFAEQVRAICLTALDADVRMLLPMVTDPAEVAWAAGILASARDSVAGCPPVPLGIMVEVPATALRIADYAGSVDFVSIGTNDLAQYALAADRGNAAVAGLARQDHPAVLGLIAHVCARLPGVPVAVCGALAADPHLTEALVGMGVTELSVPPGAVPRVKAAVRDCG